MKVERSPEARATGLARMLADPLRLKLLLALMPGPLPVSELVALAGAPQPNVSNHLKALRESGMVRTARSGRQVAYEVADGEIAHLVQVLTAVSGIRAQDWVPAGPLVEARTCYDHLAGRLGVELFEALASRGAIRIAGSPWADVALGPEAQEVLGNRLGIDLAAVATAAARRRFAFACPDWTSKTPHLGGALAAAILERCFAQGWLARRTDNPRGVALTEAGKAELAWLLEIPSRPHDVTGKGTGNAGGCV